MKAFGANSDFAVGAAFPSGRWKATTKPPPATSPALRKPRLLNAASAVRAGSRMVESSMAVSLSTELDLSGMFDGRSDAHIGAAPANVSRHGRINVGIFRMRSAVEQSRRRHD